MRLLIDTHALLWFCEGSHILSPKARAAMEDASNELFVSHASAWETVIKVSIGKLKLQTDCRAIFPGCVGSEWFCISSSCGGALRECDRVAPAS